MTPSRLSTTPVAPVSSGSTVQGVSEAAGDTPTLAIGGALVRTDALWCELTAEPLDIGAIYDFVIDPGCGGIVLFSGTARDHAAGRPGVSALAYEAYEAHVVPRLVAIGEHIAATWPARKVAIVHRIGPVALGESSVVVAVATPHRPEAFEAARYGIDTLKATVPIWKSETWDGGTDWGLAAHPIASVSAHRDDAQAL
jgi:molybdopterin synthase catalytic subunit